MDAGCSFMTESSVKQFDETLHTTIQDGIISKAVW